jgi:serine/threonine protein kinase
MELNALINPRYKVKNFIGSGSFGQVFDCEDTQYPDTPTVVKVIDVNNNLEQIMKEIEILNKLKLKNGFPNLRDFSHSRSRNKVYIIQDKLGMSFKDAKERHGNFPLLSVLKIGEKLVSIIE